MLHIVRKSDTRQPTQLLQQVHDARNGAALSFSLSLYVFHLRLCSSLFPRSCVCAPSPFPPPPVTLLRTDSHMVTRFTEAAWQQEQRRKRITGCSESDASWTQVIDEVSAVCGLLLEETQVPIALRRPSSALPSACLSTAAERAECGYGHEQLLSQTGWMCSLMSARSHHTACALLPTLTRRWCVR